MKQGCKIHGLPLTHLQTYQDRCYRVCQSCLRPQPNFELVHEKELIRQLSSSLQALLQIFPKSQVFSRRLYFLDSLVQFRAYLQKWEVHLQTLDDSAMKFFLQELTKKESWDTSQNQDLQNQVSRLAYMNSKKSERIENLEAELRLKNKIITDVTRENAGRTLFVKKADLLKSERPQQRSRQLSLNKAAQPDQALADIQKLQIRMKNGVKNQDYVTLLSNLSKYPNLRKLDLYLKDYKLTEETGQTFLAGIAHLPKLQELLIHNYFKDCENIQFIRIRSFQECAALVKNGKVRAGPW